VIPPDDDLGVWKWMIGIGLSVLSGLIGGVWVSRGILANLEQTDIDHEKRLKLVEQKIKDQELFCTYRKTEILTELSKEICQVVKLSMREAEIQNNKELSTIIIAQAVQGQQLQQIQEDVAAIFGRLDRRTEAHAEGRL